jgi:hypothetical protein
MKEDWIECWRKLPQRKIQEWIERIRNTLNKQLNARVGMSIERDWDAGKEIQVELDHKIEEVELRSAKKYPCIYPYGWRF